VGEPVLLGNEGGREEVLWASGGGASDGLVKLQLRRGGPGGRGDLAFLGIYVNRGSRLSHPKK